jgi:signal transduction histidine kinase/CheY-like chemotaxis protein
MLELQILCSAKKGDALSRTSLDERVLVLAPTGRDGPLIGKTLGAAGVEVDLCRHTDELCEEIRRGVGAAIVAEEGLHEDGLRCLRDVFASQPPWSEVPLLILTMTGTTTSHSAQVARLLEAKVSLSFLERPLRMLTLKSAVHSALRARRRQYELRDLLEHAESEVKQRDRFLAMLGHELRNPLAAIRTAVEILDQFGTSEPGLAEEQCQIIGRQSESMARLVDDLLDVARITSGRIELIKEVVDLRLIVERGVESISLAHRQRSQDIVMRLPNLPLLVHGDVVRLEQVITNLLSNAFRYSSSGSKVEVDVRESDNQAVVVVCDHGEGIEPELLEHLFDPFIQGSQSLARLRGGLGLGLTVVRELVEHHGGRVTAQSEGTNCGSRFTVCLPLARQTDTIQPRVHEASTSTPGRRIVVIEDNPDVRMTLVRLLERQGHEVFSVSDGQRGLEVLLSVKPDLALIDIGLPGLDGYTVAAEVRSALGDRIKLVAVTGYGQAQDRQRALITGFDSHLVKPLDFRQLAQLIGACESHNTATANAS